MTGTISWEDMQGATPEAPQPPLVSWEDMATPPAPEKTAPAKMPSPWSAGSNAFLPSIPQLGMGFVRGLRDIPDSGAQLLTRTLEALAPAGSSMETWAKGQRENVESINSGAEEDYRKNWLGGIDPGLDIGRIAGNVAATLPLSGTGAVAKGGGAITNAIEAAGTGAGVGAVSQPVEGDGNFWRQKLNQAEIGMGGGMAGSAIGSTISRLINPNAASNPAIQKLIDENISVTPGQVLGGGFRTAEDKATSWPLIGDLIKGGRAEGYQDLNRAVVGRVLDPIGETLPDAVKTGRDAVQYAQGRIKEAYNNLLPTLKIAVDPQFSTEIHNLHSMATEGLTPDLAKQFDGFLQNQVVGKLAPSGTMDGITLKEIESQIGNEAQNFLHSASASERKYGTALSALQDSLRGLVSRSNPDAAAQLAKINQSYGYMKILEKAAGSVGAPEGVFTPAQLQSAVKASDRTSNDRAFAAGTARMQDLSDAARSVLPSTVPDSGTGGRLGQMALITGAAKELGPDFLGTPALLAGGAYGAASAAYSRPGMRMLANLLARRPQGAEGIADALRRVTPYAGAAGAAETLPGLYQTMSGIGAAPGALHIEITPRDKRLAVPSP